MDQLDIPSADSKFAQFERPITARRVRWMQHRVKAEWGWSARQMAERLNVSRAHLKRIERGSRAASEMFCLHFRNLERELFDHQRAQQKRSREVMTVVSKFKLPARFEILVEPRRSTGCRKWFVPVTPNQKMHTSAECKRAARRRRGAKR